MSIKPLALLDADSLLYKVGFGIDTTVYTLRYEGKVVGRYQLHREMQKAAKAKGWSLRPLTEGVTVQKAVRHGSESVAEEAADGYMRRIYEYFQGHKVMGFYLGKSAYRHDLWPLYKVGRVDSTKPHHWDFLVDYFSDKWGIINCHDVEADDMLAMMATECMEEGTEYVLASIDKDLLQIPGTHFNYSDMGADGFPHREVTEDEAWYNFYRQVLTGDSGDDIPGLRGVGPKTADKVLADGRSPGEWEMLAFDKYVEHHGHPDYAMEHFELAAKLLWMFRKPNTPWSPLVL